MGLESHRKILVVCAVYGGQEMIWTTEKPTRPGWYWARNKTRVPQIVEVEANKHGDLHYGIYTLRHYGSNLEWAGPIPEPEEQDHGPR